jgi:hypothetical protein
MKKFTVLFATFLALGSTELTAHHAMEFIDLESYNTAPQGSFVFHLHHDYMVEDRDQPQLDHWELTPGISYGITDRMMVDVHGHFAKFGVGHVQADQAMMFTPLGPSPFFEALAFSLQYRLTENSPIQVAAVINYEEALPRSVDLLDGQRVFGTSLIINKPFRDHRNLLMNLHLDRDGEEMVSSWGVGYRSPLTPDAHGLSGGIEILGDFEGGYSFLPGIYFPLGMQDLIFKTGLEITPDQGVTRSNLTLMVRF